MVQAKHARDLYQEHYSNKTYTGSSIKARIFDDTTPDYCNDVCFNFLPKSKGALQLQIWGVPEVSCPNFRLFKLSFFCIFLNAHLFLVTRKEKNHFKQDILCVCVDNAYQTTQFYGPLLYMVAFASLLDVCECASNVFAHIRSMNSYRNVVYSPRKKV